MKKMTDKSYKWFALVLVWGSVMFQQGIRQIYGATLPSIASTFHISSVEIGLVGTVFMFVYGFMMLCSGFLSDKFSRKWILVCGIALYSAGGFLSGYVSCVGALVITYGIISALGQPLVFPPGTALLMQLHGEETRATALSIVQSALYVGIVLCAIGSGCLAELESDGWRSAFKLAGALALVWALVTAVAMRDTRVEATGCTKVSLKDALRAVFVKKSAILYAIYLIILNGVTIGFTIWTPSFVMDAFPHLSKGMAVLHAVLWMNAGALIGVILGGKIGDRFALARQGVRMEILAVGVFGCGVAWFFCRPFICALRVLSGADGVWILSRHSGFQLKRLPL